MAGFLAYPPDRPLKNLVPIYQTSNDIGPMLSTVPKGELLFYALPVDEVKYESFLGTWLCKMTDGILINREFNLKLESEKNNLQSSVGVAGYSVENLSTNGALIDFTINYVAVCSA